MENTTKRAMSHELEKILFEEIKVLDQGFVRVIDYMGNDSSIVQAARISYGKGTKTQSSDAGLINYLFKNAHTSVFEMCEIKLHIKAPIFVARQWLRHRTANVNEYSARYSEMEDSFYLPNKEDIKGQDKTNKQARGLELEDSIKQESQDMIHNLNTESYKAYLSLLEKGVARELARGILPTNIYTQFYWKIDLNNLLRFVMLRSSNHSQQEIKAYSDTIKHILKLWTPMVYNAFTNFNQMSLSANAIEVIKKAIKGEKVSREGTSIGKSEWKSLEEAFGI
ncbi:FAD-dependent thymidylate synthase [Candidatus Nesciobacter abundans]|uniref:Flavin-dependent thymidylate synthase n=2 Tax=Candidatus Nesciobacter abundans TaxID=2601668 RepID=A0A5C0UHX0_9PROT|nr:FAD-dependent thymidylate synthase [Candidatus Nesciobacter abundans]